MEGIGFFVCLVCEEGLALNGGDDLGDDSLEVDDGFLDFGDNTDVEDPAEGETFEELLCCDKEVLALVLVEGELQLSLLSFLSLEEGALVDLASPLSFAPVKILQISSVKLQDDTEED